MAETEKPEQPQTNGLENGLDEDERNKMRPADIDADVKEMERRKRVEMIMSSKLFREELERIIELQLKDGNGPAGLLQQISDMMGIQSGKLHTTHMFRGSNCVTPINDIRGVESMGYEKGEKNLRCKLASVFRLMDLYGWSQGINNQITARLNQDEEHFLVNPHGMLFNEITASSLVKVDMQGNVVEPGTTNFSVNTQGFLLHSAIHASRPDINCVIHIKTPSVLAVSSLKCGLLPICQEALVIGEVSQHPFVSGIFEPEEREKIIRNLGPHNKVLLLHNHGAVCCGATVEEAFYNVYNTVLACETQMKLMPMGMDNLLLVSDETRKQVYDAAHRAPDANDKKKFRVGEMEFEALIRMLDNAGFRTGYIYRHPLVKGELPKPKNDVEVPPAVSSLGYLIEQEELYKQGNWKKYVDGRNRLDRTKWLNSPNVYQKVEILETGTSDPKKITKWVDQNSEEWVAESSPTHSSTPVKIDSALQFVPKGTNPKEFKKLQQQIKENRRADKITSGPQSHILEGVSWEEARKLQDANITQTGDQVILVGAASKGIIQRNYQHNALVYKTPYAKNPFDSMSDKEIEDYKQLVERKQRGDTDYEESQSESEAISSSRQDALRHFKSPLLSPQSATSETEEESRDEPRVLRIETKTAPRPIQAEVVLSDAEPDTTDARVERSHSARYPKAEKPESVTLMNSFRKSWSLKREKDKSKDVENIYESRNLHPNFILKECERDRMTSFHCCVARLKQLTHKPVIVDLGTKALRPLLKSASDPCNLSTLSNETEGDDRESPGSNEINTSLSCSNIVNMSELQQRLSVRKKLLHSAKMKFLGFNKSGPESECNDTPPNSPMRALISEIRETISEIMSPERSKFEEEPDYFSSMRWIERPKFVSRSSESELGKAAKVPLSTSFNNNPLVRSSSETFSDFQSDFTVLKHGGEYSERSNTVNCNCAAHGGKPPASTRTVCSAEEDSNITSRDGQIEQPAENVLTEIVTFVNASDEEGTYTITDDSCLQTYSFTETTETEWYYNKTIMKLENSQTMLEIKETENKENLDLPAVKYIDTGIDTDFTEEKENEGQEVEEPKEQVEVVEDLDADPPVCESSGLNKSSETDSSFLKSSSGRTSNDVDTSFAFKTETENSDKSPQKSQLASVTNRNTEEKNFLEEMLVKAKEPIEEESSDSSEVVCSNDTPKNREKDSDTHHQKLTDIPESPEFTNIDTEDAPVTSSSKDTSPEVAGTAGQLSEDEVNKEPEVDAEEEKENFKPERKRKKNVKSSTEITVKKELKDNNSKEPVVSEIRLTITKMNKCQSEKYEVKIQDVTNTSEDLSRSVSSVGENVDSYESFEIVEKSCDCEAQQNLEELQDEVSSTIEKLHTIEDYFEGEIKKHTNAESETKKPDEMTFEYRYTELEEVTNESRDKMATLETLNDIPMQQKDSTEFFVSSLLGDICGEIEVCSIGNEEDMFNYPCQEYAEIPSGEEIQDIAMSSAFIAAILSESVLDVNEGNAKSEEGDIVKVICNVEEISVFSEVEKCVVEILDGIIDGLNLEQVETCQGPFETESKHENLVNELTEDNPRNELSNYPTPDSNPQVGDNSNEIECQEWSQTTAKVSAEEMTADSSNCNTLLETDLQPEGKTEEVEYDYCQQSHYCTEEITVDSSNYVMTPQTELQSEYDSGGVEFQDWQQSSVVYSAEEITVDSSSPPILHSTLLPESCQEWQQINAEVHSTEEIIVESSNQVITVVSDIQPDGTSEGVACEEWQQINVEATEEVVVDSSNLTTLETDILLEGIEPQECQEENATATEINLSTSTLEKELQPDGNTEGRQTEAAADETAIDSNNQTLPHSTLHPETYTEATGCEEGQQINSEPHSTGENTDEIPSNKTLDPVHVGDEKQEEGEDCQQTIPEVNSADEVTVLTTDSNVHTERKEGDGTECHDGRYDEPSEDSERNKDEAPESQQQSEEVSSEEKPPAEALPECKELLKEDESCTLGSEQAEKGNNGNDTVTVIPPEVEVIMETAFTDCKQPLEEIKAAGDFEPPPCIKTDATPQSEEQKANCGLTASELNKMFFPPPLKAITFEPHTGQGTLMEKLTPVDYILNNLLNSVTERNKKNLTTMNDVINFIVTNEESPTNSLTDFEDMENIISTSSSVVADIIDTIESQMEGEVESLPDEEEELKDPENTKVERKRKKKGEPMFKVTIATPARKEIFINYSLDCSSTFNTSTELPQQLPEMCNSYIKTDDVNEDFENMSSDNPEFFSVCSSGKNSLNSSFCSVECHGDQFCCVGCEENPVKSPRSLAIIQEVDEGDSSTSSEAQVTTQTEFPVQ